MSWKSSVEVSNKRLPLSLTCHSVSLASHINCWKSTLFVPPKFCISIVLVFSGDHCKSQEYYGIFRSGLWRRTSLSGVKFLFFRFSLILRLSGMNKNMVIIGFALRSLIVKYRERKTITLTFLWKLSLSQPFLCVFVSRCIVVDGKYSEWTSWSQCTATCGGGTQMRKRTCTNPPPENGGKSCLDQGLGPELETQMCNVQPCPSK